MVSEKQHAILEAYFKYKQKYNTLPTMQEVADILGYRSHSPVFYHVSNLKKKGYLTSLNKKNTSTQLTKKGYDYLASKKGTSWFF